MSPRTHNGGLTPEVTSTSERPAAHVDWAVALQCAETKINSKRAKSRTVFGQLIHFGGYSPRDPLYGSRPSESPPLEIVIFIQSIHPLPKTPPPGRLGGGGSLIDACVTSPHQPQRWPLFCSLSQPISGWK
jgi:hypothetical protein